MKWLKIIGLLATCVLLGTLLVGCITKVEYEALQIESMTLDEPERLSSYDGAHQRGLNPSDFYYSNTALNLDDYWTSDGFTNPEGEWLMCYSKKTWLYPSLNFECIWPALTTPNIVAIVGLESGGRGLISRHFFLMAYNYFYLSAGAGAVNENIRIENFLPADYDTVKHNYGIKLNKCNVEAFIDGKLVGIILLGLPEAMPIWANNPPYAICSTGSINTAMRTPVCILMEPTDPKPSTTLGIKWGSYYLLCNDGDPLPPRQYALYSENTSMKWTGFSTDIIVTSHPIPVWGYEKKTLLFQSSADGTLTLEVYAGGAWREWHSITLTANKLEVYNLNGDVPIARCIYTPTNNDTITVAE